MPKSSPPVKHVKRVKTLAERHKADLARRQKLLSSKTKLSSKEIKKLQNTFPQTQHCEDCNGKGMINDNLCDRCMCGACGGPKADCEGC